MIKNFIGRTSVLAAALGLALLLPVPAKAVGVGHACGGFVGPICDQGLWCDPLPGTCNVINPPGKCVKIPERCPKSLIPVCGCGKITYGNDCQRQMARNPKDHAGACNKK